MCKSEVEKRRILKEERIESEETRGKRETL